MAGGDPMAEAEARTSKGRRSATRAIGRSVRFGYDKAQAFAEGVVHVPHQKGSMVARVVVRRAPLGVRWQREFTGEYADGWKYRRRRFDGRELLDRAFGRRLGSRIQRDAPAHRWVRLDGSDDRLGRSARRDVNGR